MRIIWIMVMLATLTLVCSGELYAWSGCPGWTYEADPREAWYAVGGLTAQTACNTSDDSKSMYAYGTATRSDYVFDSINCRCHFTYSSKQVKGGPVSVPPDFYLSKGFAFSWIRNFSGTYSKDGTSCNYGASDPPGQPQIYWDEYWVMHFC